jgi:cytochrome c553
MPRTATRIVTAALALSVVLLALAAAIVYVASERRLNARHPLPISTIRVPQDAASIERARHLFRAIGSCTLCHGEDPDAELHALWVYQESVPPQRFGQK